MSEIGGGLAQAGLLLPRLAVQGTGQLWIVHLIAAAQAVPATVNELVPQAFMADWPTGRLVALRTLGTPVERPVSDQDAGQDLARAVRAAVVGDE